MRSKTILSIACVLLLSGGMALGEDEAAPAEPTVTAAQPAASIMDSKSYLLSPEPLFADTEILWPGFLTGMKASYKFQEKFVDPVGNPIYFESPFIDTNLELIYLWHDFPRGSQLGGGEANVLAVQARVALTDRLAFIATKSGYSWLKTGITPDADGWNDWAWGLKYLILADEANEFALTGGLRWEMRGGDDDIIMGGDGGSNELNPFISVAKGWDRFHMLGALNYRVPMDTSELNQVLQWDLHADYEIAPDALPGFFPLLEIHGLHYLSNGDALPLSVGGLDYSNFGSDDVAGDFVAWGDVGFRWELTPNASLGAGYGFPITDPDDDIFNQRVTIRLTLSY
ncbi:MAG: hypothetical protein JXO22_06675 [Phycisphaerae bacterium]|nr:hypothetical protein [Phycisphaerae bacterium]